VPGLIITRAAGWLRNHEMPVGSAWRKVALDALLAPVAWAATRRFRPDLIHAYLHEGALIGAFLSRFYRSPLIFDFQGSLTSEMLDHRFISPRSSLLPVLRRLERWIDSQPQAVLPSSAHAAGLLARDFGVPQDRIHPLLDSVDTDLFRPATEIDASAQTRLRAVLNLQPGRLVVVYLGLLAPYQGTDILLRAVKSLEFQPKPIFLIMGFPFVDHYRRMAAELGIAADVRFTGAIPYEEAPVYLSLGDLAVAPKRSTTEGSGKLLPYMAAALPVVASDLPVHREYLGELGWYYPPEDEPAMAKTIAVALADSQGRRERGRALRALAAARFSWQRAAALLEQIYRACLDTTRRSGNLS